MDTFNLKLNDGEMTVFAFNENLTALPSIIMVHDAHGLTNTAIQQAQWLSQQGYRVFAPDVFYRVGKLVTTTTLGDTPESMMALRKGMTNKGHKSDMETLGIHIKNTYGSNLNLGITGFCLGGRVVYLSASNTRVFDAAVAFYPTRLREPDPAIENSAKPLDGAKGINIPLMLFFPEYDGFNPDDGIEEIRKASETNPYPMEIIKVSGADHGFAQPASQGFHPESSEQAWQQALEFFSIHLNKV
tara:strand:+ start:25816 stop:26547 length:732 start_codon:yes stop_codon:yes gene_type:complete